MAGQQHARGVGVGRAHAKAVLLGEHAVVYGQPAIAVPLRDLTIEALARPCPAGTPDLARRPLTVGRRRPSPQVSCPGIAADAALREWGSATELIEIDLHGHIPQSRGLGSSAACATATVRALADLCRRAIDAEELYRLVQLGEQHAHGRASGVDARAVSADGPIWFQAGAARTLPVAGAVSLIVADSGVAASTQQAVAVARARLQKQPAAARRVLDRAATLTRAAAEDLARGDGQALGDKLIQYHDLLRELGVSTDRIERLIAAALAAGAFGAKLTGGGLGGCVLAVTGRDSAAAVRAAFSGAGAVRTWATTVGEESW
ncbi:mevalonate kinase [Nocardia tenerifensis]|uniref:mevalonate kinase n=1 Tax=Nocardia tenerifensis TaxID=228006 RepID=A0A318JWW0_9NOCA|nr:mevalonate kinase [Nocardia tenerifensis]PXX61770.1 mevalonate kinase [Nocardia tenerifensis]